MENKHKGIILCDPKERCMELDHSYFLRNLPGKVIHKYRYDKNYVDSSYYNPKINKCMVIFSKNYNNDLYLVLERNDNKIVVMRVIRTYERINNKYKYLRKSSPYTYDYVICGKVQTLDVTDDFELDYFINYEDYTYVSNIYKRLLKNKNNNKTSIILNNKFNFGDILSIHGSKEKLIFICERKDFVYVCHIGSDVFFTGMDRISKENIVEKYDQLSQEQGQKLLLKLADALELDKGIPEKVKKDVSVLVLKSKNK